MSPLKSLDPANIAVRALHLYNAYLEEGLPEYRAEGRFVSDRSER